jgi:hypothetical protein
MEYANKILIPIFQEGRIMKDVAYHHVGKSKTLVNGITNKDVMCVKIAMVAL